VKYLLDTSICIYLIEKRPPELLARFCEHAPGEIGVSAITVAELQYGVQKSQHAAQNQEALDRFLAPLVIVDFDEPAAMAYGGIRASLESQGTPIRALDTLIAAQAVSLGVTLVTNNTREFSRVPGLKPENWAAA
jgi:tRNA(fMet)-specific endonuclease VapC